MRTQFQSIVPIPQETHQRTQSMLVHLGGSMWNASQMQSQSQNQIQPQIQNSNRAQTPLQASIIQIQTQSQTQIQIQPQVQNQIQPQLDSTPVQSLINNSTVEIDLTTQQTSQQLQQSQQSQQLQQSQTSQISPITEIFDQQLNEIATEEIVPLRSESQNQNQSAAITENRVSNSIGLTLDQILERPQQRSRNFSQNQSQNQNPNRNIAQPIEIQRNSRVSLIQDQAVESTSNRFDQTIQTVAIDRTTQTIEQPQSIDQPQAPQQTQDPYNIREQIVQNARLLQRQGTTEMVIQLKPEHLGEMTLKVSVSAEGSVTASFHSDNVAVRTIIENTLVQLKNDLASQGIRVDNVEVSPQLGGEFLQQGQQDTSAWQNQNQSQAAQISQINLEDLDEDGAITAYDSSADLAPVTGQNLSSDGGVNYLV
ncbi:MAG: flagellar hook-length control protein FliK [Selenomonadaceae bacterium]|nr:flagellar hook-length control protein FliK [Selenomonadaceae bacterium]